MTYKEIIELIDAKDKLGWEKLYLIYGKKFYGFAVDKWLFSEDEAWDVVYQTLETVVLKIAEYEIKSQAHFDNLLYKIFINFLRQHYRKRRTRLEQIEFIPLEELDIFQREEDDEGVSNAEFPFDHNRFSDYTEADNGDSSNLSLIADALNQLEPLDRDLLLLKANGFTYDEIAMMLKIENKQLKVRHHRAKRKLLKILLTEKNNNHGNQ